MDDLDVVSKQSLIKFTLFAKRVTELLNYCPEELIGRNFYSLIHGQDVSLMKKCHLDCKCEIIQSILFSA